MTNYNIPEELLTRYVSCIKSIQCVLKAHRSTESSLKIVEVFGLLEKERESIHNELLAAAGVTREDNKFTFKLATIVENLLYGAKDLSCVFDKD